MDEVETVVVHLSEDRCTIGYYRMVDGVIEMLDNDGAVLCTHKLQDGENERSIAAVLTLHVRELLTGGSFNDPIDYQDYGIA